MSLAVAEVVDRYHYLRNRKIGAHSTVLCPQSSKKNKRTTRTIPLAKCRKCLSNSGVNSTHIRCLTDIRWGWKK